jgi:hypothetical protein
MLYIDDGGIVVSFQITACRKGAVLCVTGRRMIEIEEDFDHSTRVTFGLKILATNSDLGKESINCTWNSVARQ